MDKKIMAIIPARGGSKGIPGKNIVPLGEKPLISYVIEAAKRSNYVSRILVSTDDPKIAETSRQFGAEVPFFRPSELAQDESPVMPSLYHAVEWLSEHEGYRPDIIVMIQPTSPFVLSEQIDVAIEMLLSDRTADAVTTVIELPHVYHPYNVRVIKEDGSVDFFMPEKHNLYPTRQKKPKIYAFGNIYVFRHDTLMIQKSLYGKRCLPLLINPLTSFDINYPIELQIAEALIPVFTKAI